MGIDTNPIYCVRALILLLFFAGDAIQEAASFSMNNGSDYGGGGSRRNLTAAQKARKAEEQRRKQRINDNIPGKTSAIPGAQNYEMNVKQTEYMLAQQSSGLERQIRELTSQGMEDLKMLKIEEAAQAFDTIIAMKPNTYCWHAGLAKFYMDDCYQAAKSFAQNAELFESKFGQPASEERIWRDACELNILSKSTKKERKQLKDVATIEDVDQVEGVRETRKVIRLTRDLFSASLKKEFSNVALARAKLRSVCGEYTDEHRKESFQTDKKMWRLTAWFYLGLHYDVTGEYEESKKCMKMAMRQCGSGNSNDIIHTLPFLHMARRDWFDDDHFEEDVSEDHLGGNVDLDNETNDEANSDFNATMKTIYDSVDGMRVVDLRQALKERKLKSSGSKSVLKDRLLQALREDIESQ